MLNENQLLAVNHIEGPCLTLAGPGSGKTTVLIDRILNLIKHSINPSNILVITYTKDAALEMKRRFMKKAGKNYPVTFGTFHSVFYHILRLSGKYCEYEILFGARKLSFYKESLKKAGLDDDMILTIEKEVSYFYNTNGEISQEIKELIGENKFRHFIDVLEERKAGHCFLEFDDMLVKTKELLKVSEEIRHFWQNRFGFFLVDELQDINEIQFDVLKILLDNHPLGSQNIFGVGDDDQAIYGFRGARPKFMMEFPKYFLGCKIIVLDKNYRSKRLIVDKAKKLIECNKERYKKDYSAFNEDEGEIYIKTFEDETKEAKYICDILYKENESKQIRDTAILYRNRNKAELITHMLKQRKIRFFHDEGQSDIRNSEEAKDVLSFLRLVSERYKRCDIIRIMNKPERMLSRGGLYKEDITLEEWQNYYEKEDAGYGVIEQLRNSCIVCKNFSVYLCINFFRKGMGYDEYVTLTEKRKGKDYTEVLRRLDILTKLSNEYKTIEGYINFLSENINENKVKRTDEKVCLYTFHGSKGLEFERVFILDCLEGITPSKNAKDDSLIEEERRMFYVAITRAKEELILCIPKKLDGNKMCESRFVSELEYDIID